MDNSKDKKIMPDESQFRGDCKAFGIQPEKFLKWIGSWRDKIEKGKGIPVRCYQAAISYKGQLISECLFDFLNLLYTHRKIWQISASESKKWSNHKIKEL